MKKILIIFLTVFTIFASVSCGGDTRDWPRLCPDLMADDVLKIVVDYSEIKDNKIIDYETKYCTLKENMDKNIYEFKWYPYEEKIKTNKPYANWAEKTIIIVELSDNTKMKIEYYNYGVCDGLISFKESEYHFIPGLFDVYEKIVGDGEKYVS